MNKQQAKEALQQGHRLTHALYDKHEWVKQEGLIMIMDDNAEIDAATFWSDRKGTSWEKGWEIYTPEVVRVAKYTIQQEFYEDGTSKLSRTCEGYNSLELLGLITMAQYEIIQQIKGVIKPDVIKREVII